MAVESSSSNWWPMSPPWLSPGATWFVLFSLVVGAVAVMSRAQQAPPSNTVRRRLTRSASSMVLERLRSFSVFFFVNHPISGVQEEDVSLATSSTERAAAVAAAAEEEDLIILDEAPAAVASPPAETPQAAAVAEAAAATVERPRKRREAAAKVVAVKRRGRAFTEEEVGLGTKAEVNARAERFIRQFREDLRLQRLVSVLNRTHALAGGVA